MGSHIGTAGDMVGGYLFDPMNLTGQFGKGSGIGAFLNPTGTGTFQGASTLGLGGSGSNAAASSLMSSVPSLIQGGSGASTVGAGAGAGAAAGSSGGLAGLGSLFSSLFACL